MSQITFQEEKSPSELSIVCGLDNLTLTDLRRVDSLAISRLDKETRDVLASISAHCDQDGPLSTEPGARVAGHLSPNSRYLRIVWDNHAPGLEGNYVCEAYGVDSTLKPITAAKQLPIKTKQPGLRLGAVPDVIKIGLTTQLHINCTLPDHSALNVTKMASLEIFKQQNGIKCQFAKIKSGLGGAVLTGAFKASLNGSMETNWTSLGMTWGNITASDSGEYICEGSGVNDKGHPVFFSRKMNITWKYPEREELVKLLFELYDKEQEFIRVGEEKKQMLATTNGLINRLNKTKCRKPSSCDGAHYRPGQHVVTLEPDDGLGPISALCEGVAPGEIWTVFQKRFDGSVDFYRNYSDYDEGFGSLKGEFWLGLKNIRRLLLQNENKNKLRVEITEMDSEKNHTKNYHTFSLGPPRGYKLHAVGFDDLGYGMSFNSGYNFSTPDHGVPRLAVLNRAGWWFNYDSPYVNLNGIWGVKGKRYSVYWSEFRRDRNIILSRTEMKFRRNF